MEESHVRRDGLETYARFQCAGMSVTPNMGSVQSQESAGAILATVGLDAESARNFQDVSMGAAARVLSASVRRDGQACSVQCPAALQSV